MAINEKEFNYNLNKVISWTNMLSKNFDYRGGNYGTVFRQTNPKIHGHFLYHIDSDYTTWNINDREFDNFQEALDQVLKLREGNDSSYADEEAMLGRVLRFEIGFTTHDGIMIAESECFFDESDVPPIDTWFYLEKKIIGNVLGILYCWIPQPFEYIVEQGMKYDFIKCCTWLPPAGASM